MRSAETGGVGIRSFTICDVAIENKTIYHTNPMGLLPHSGEGHDHQKSPSQYLPLWDVVILREVLCIPPPTHAFTHKGART